MQHGACLQVIFFRLLSQSGASKFRHSVFKQRLMLLELSLWTMFAVLGMICKGNWKKAAERRRKVYIHKRGCP